MLPISVRVYCLPGFAAGISDTRYSVQYAGNKDPFLVTLILSCCQIIAMIFTSTLTDRFGRRPLTVWPYAVTVLSVLCLGIIGCVDYTQKATSSLLVCFEYQFKHLMMANDRFRSSLRAWQLFPLLVPPLLDMPMPPKSLGSL
jgi:MFS family permease